MADNATENFDRMRRTDLSQVGMAGEAVFHFASEGRREGNGFYTPSIPPGDCQEGEKEKGGKEEEYSAHIAKSYEVRKLKRL